jgi:hypothetical protein
MTTAKKHGNKPKRLKRLMARAAATNSGRECGGCTACCSVMAVPELQKGMYRACFHVGGHGCAIYSDRPRSCRSWSCQWRLGEIEGARPDESGILVNLGFRGGAHYEVYELWAGAASHPVIVEMLAKLSLPVFVFERVTQGRTGVQFQGQQSINNHCQFGHGAAGRISLPLISNPYR